MEPSIFERLEDGTIKITISIPSSNIKETEKKLKEEITAKAEIPGFRKGKAPHNIVEERLNKEQLREDILKKLLPQFYLEALQKHDLRPIMAPKIHIDKIEDDKDWTFTALTCEAPVIDLKDYKDKVKEVTAKSKIVIPGKEQKKPGMDELLKAVLDCVSIKIPVILTNQEVDRLLAQLLDDIKRLGLNLDQYLASTKRTAEDLRREYGLKAENDIKLEFILQKIAETEKITVDPKEIDEAIQKSKDPKEKENLEKNRYLLAGIIRQQKTLDFLMNL